MPHTTAQLQLLSVDGAGLRFEATNHRGQKLVLDSGAGAIAFDPMQALAAALGACTGMDVISILRKKRQHVTAYAIDVDGDRREEHPRAYTSIEIVHRLRGKALDPTAVDDAIRLSTTRYCSVAASLAPGIPIHSRFELAEEEA
jgi:putative redox protein